MTNQSLAASALPIEAVYLAMAEDPCAAVTALTAAQIKLSMGANVAAFRFGDQEMRLNRVDVAALEKLISKLQVMCHSKHGRGRAARVGPHARWLNPRNYVAFGGW